MAFPTGWAYKATVTIGSAYVDALLTDFPVLLSEANLPAGIFTHARSDGGDIRATTDAAGTTQIAVEVVSFDDGGACEIWAKVPSVSSSVDTVVYVWYGAASETMPAADATYGSQAVWSDYAGVWHDGGSVDSTVNGNDGTAAGGVTLGGATGKIGAGTDYDGTDDKSAISGLSFASGTDLTVTAWIQYHDTDTGGSAFGTEEITAAPSSRIQAHVGYSGTVYWDYGNQSTRRVSYAPSLSTGDLALFTFYGDADGAMGVYENGVSKVAETKASSPPQTLTSFWIGGFSTTGYHNGIIDEFRLRPTVLSVAWVAAEYTNQNTPGTFATAGAETAIGGTAYFRRIGMSGGMSDMNGGF